MTTVLAANDFGDNIGDGVAGPVGLLIIVVLVIATVLLMRSMNKHLKRVPEKFPDKESARPADPSGSDRGGSDQSAPVHADSMTDGKRAKTSTPSGDTRPGGGAG